MSAVAQLWRGVRFTLLLWFLTVVVITLPLLGLARLVAPDAASGSLIRRDGQVVGSRLIGQGFSSARYLQSRPAGAPNLAASNPELAARVAAVAQPAADLLQDSASGVDPHISLAAARQQLPRLARERQLPLAELERLIPQHQEGPLGLQAIEPVVNVLRFNLALDRLATAATTPSPPVPARP